MSCEVKLLAYTSDPVRIVAAAAKLCYSASSAATLFDDLDTDKVRGFLAQLREVGHLSPFEHAAFTFAVDGLSRIASHQLVRHRVASFSQQSQRYVTMGQPKVVTPPKLAQNPEARKLFETQAAAAFDVYEKMVALGIPKEDARFVLPHGWETSMVITMNARELHHFFRLRLCRRAQWEIQELAREMLILVRNVAFELFETAGPSCVTEGRCGEFHSCARPYASTQQLLDAMSWKPASGGSEKHGEVS